MISRHSNMERLRQSFANAEMQHSDGPRLASVRLALQPDQRLIVTEDPDGHVFVVSSGILMLEARIAGDQRRVLEILFAGDVFPTLDAPRLPGMLLVAAATSELIRYRASTIEPAARSDPALCARIQAALTHRSARRMLHLASLAEPNAEGRLADFLIEVGLYGGQAMGSGRQFDLPFTREDIASYLALNPDTLSRLFTRLKQKGAISVAQRRVHVPDWKDLCQLSPLSGAMVELAARRPSWNVPPPN